MKKLMLLTVLTATMLTTASANFSFMGDMIRDMTDAAKEMKNNTIDVAKDIKTEGIDAGKDVKNNLKDSAKELNADVSNRGSETFDSNLSDKNTSASQIAIK